MLVNRGIPLDAQTQVGLYGSSDHVLQQRMSDLEGYVQARRWEVKTLPPRRNFQRCPHVCMSDEQLSLQNPKHALGQDRSLNTDTFQQPQERALLDKEP